MTNQQTPANPPSPHPRDHARKPNTAAMMWLALGYVYALADLGLMCPEPQVFADWYVGINTVPGARYVPLRQAFERYRANTYDVCAHCAEKWGRRGITYPAHDVSCEHYGTNAVHSPRDAGSVALGANPSAGANPGVGADPLPASPSV